MTTFFPPAMGNVESSEKKKKQQTETASGQQYQGMKPFHAKNVLLLHKSNATQLNVVRNFRDALISKTEGTVEVTNFINIAEGSEIPESPTWLDELHNVVLLILTPADIEQFGKIMLQKGFADKNGMLHSKVFSVSFGKKLDSEWPSKGLKKGSRNLRDFHFGFSNVESLRPQDFGSSARLNSIIVAIKGADIKDQFQY